MSHFNQRMLYGINEPEEIKEPTPPKNYPKKEEIKSVRGNIHSSEQNQELYNKAFILAKKLIMMSIKDDFRLKKEIINRIASILFVNETTSILGGDRFKGCISLAEEIVNNLFSD